MQELRNIVPQNVPGSASRVPAGRSAPFAGYTALAFLPSPVVAGTQVSRRDKSHRKQTRCGKRFPAFLRDLFGFPHTKEKTHATRKTRHKTPGSAQEVSQEDEGILPHKEQTLPIRARSRQSRRSLRKTRSSREETPISPLVDPACRRRRS